MPALAYIYAVFLAFSTIASAWQNAHDKRPLWFNVLDLAADAILLLLFCAYWLPNLGWVTPPVFVALFLFCLGWFLGWIPHNLAEFQQDDLPVQLNLRQKRIAFAAMAGLARRVTGLLARPC